MTWKVLFHINQLRYEAVIHFENGHYGSSGPLLIRTMSPKSKAMSPNFISGRNIKQAGRCSKGSLFIEWINSERDNKQRKLGSFASSKKKGGAQIVFLQHSTLTRHLNLADHKLVILATSLSLREHGSMREKKHTPQSTMMLLNCVDCMVSEYLPLPKFKSLIVQV